MKPLRLLFLLLLLLSSGNALAIKIAVTDLAYAERVSGYFHLVDYHNKSSVRASQNVREHDSFESSSASSRSSYSGKSQTDYTEVESSYSYIEYGELRKFVGDIKGGNPEIRRISVNSSKTLYSQGQRKNLRHYRPNQKRRLSRGRLRAVRHGQRA